jgi:chloride channel 7
MKNGDEEDLSKLRAWDDHKDADAHEAAEKLLEERKVSSSSKVVPYSENLAQKVSLEVEQIESRIEDAEEIMEKITGLHFHRSPYMRETQIGGRMVGGSKPRDLDKYMSFESTSYITPDTVEEERWYMRMTKKKWGRRRAFLWLLYATIGVTVSLLITLILQLCGFIEKTRVKHTGYALANDNVSGAWLIWVGSSLGMTLVATFVVLFEPAAASSGIPGLIAYLNGVDPLGGKSPLTGKSTSFISLETMSAKIVGMVASIPSGLAIGPEGPIIHISALVAMWTAKVVQAIERKLSPGHSMHATMGEQRDFLATGAACGICTAFRAPLAGTLFVVEEAASFFTTKHLEFTFFACLAAYWCQWTIGVKTTGEDATLSKFQQTTGFFCNLDSPINMIFYIVVAVIGGLIGALFNYIVERCNRFRTTHVNKSAWKRVIEVALLTLATGTAVVFLPKVAECKFASRNLVLKDSAGCLAPSDIYQISHGTVSHDYITQIIEESISYSHKTNGTAFDLLEKLKAYRVESSHNDPEHDVVMLDRLSEFTVLHYNHSYNCNKDHEYNDMAMLWLNGGVKGVKVLMQRGFPHMISKSTLFIFFGVYFVLAALTAGTSVPAGLVVPMLLIGGSYGRLTGLVALDVKKMYCTDYQSITGDPSDVYFWSTIYRWMIRDCSMPDPGTFAVVGMAAFMGGSGRITLMLATVILELTADAGMIAPVGITCVCSMLIGNLFNHGLYHGLIPLMNIPFLNATPAPIMYVSRVRDIVKDRAVVLHEKSHIGELKYLASRIESGKVTHNAFPVVKEPHSPQLQGLLTRVDLFRILKELERPELSKDLLCGADKRTVNVMKYADRSPITVFPHTTVARAYDIFRKLGLRHMVVVARNGDVCGMITRKSLMLFRLVEHHQKELDLVKSLQRKVRMKQARKRQAQKA